MPAAAKVVRAGAHPVKIADAAPAREIPAGPAERQVGRPEAEVERRPLKMLDGSREEQVSVEPKLKN